jgi:pyruvate-formate lyase
MKIKPTDAEFNLLDLAVRFTERYQNTVTLNKSAREVACLETIFPDTLLGPEHNDLFAGRIVLPLAGFTNQMYPEQDAADGVGYCYDHHRAVRILAENHLEGSELAGKIEELSSFWKSNTCYRLINDAMDEPMRMALPSRKYPDDSAIAHRLYRIGSPSPDYTPLLELGVQGFRAQLVQGLESADECGREFLQSGIDYLDLFMKSIEAYRVEFCRRAANEEDIQRRHDLNRVAQAMEALAVRAPETFFEAIQLVHLYTMCGFTCNAFGRLDDLYGPFLVRDLENGTLFEEEAVRLLTSYWQLIDERFPNGRLTIGGEGRENPDAGDVFCRVAMEATKRYLTGGLREHRLAHRGGALSPQVALRFSKKTPKALRDQSLDVLAAGTTFPLLYNDDVNIPAVANAFRISEEDAAQYTFFDCGEYIIHAKSIGTPSCIINLPKALEVALHDGIDPRNGKRLGPPNPKGTDFSTFENVWEAYAHQIEFTTHQSARFQKLVFEQLNTQASFVALSLMMPASLKNARGILDGGCEMLGGTYETYGNITAADSLFAIQKAVYEEGLVSIGELIAQQDSDFTDRPDLKEQLLALPKFGNDLDAVDAMAQQVNEQICTTTREQADRVGLHHYLVVVINNSANIELGRHVNATADGRAAGVAVTNGHTPTPGMDTQGITALLNSILKISPMLHAGAVHNIRFCHKTMEQHREQVEALLTSYFKRGGTQAMITVTSREELKDAQQHPENYHHLLVRVGGYSAVFVELPPYIQQQIINRNAY